MSTPRTTPPRIELPQLAAAMRLLDAGRGDGVGTVELLFRRAPEDFGYLVAGGIAAALDVAEGWELDGDASARLRAIPALADCSPAAFARVEALRCTGDLWAVPEGTVVMPGEPILRITAPLVEALLLGAAAIPEVRLETQVATCATRLVDAARGRMVLDGGTGHDQGLRLRLARVATLGGFEGTTSVGGVLLHDLPPAPAGVLPLTGDEDLGVLRQALQQVHLGAVQLPWPLDPIRLVSTRQRLDQAGKGEVAILVAGPLTESAIDDCTRRGLPVDGFVIEGTLAAPPEHGSLEATCELVALADGPPDSWSGEKQVWRQHDDDGEACGDLVGLADEPPCGTPLLVPMLRAGELIDEPETLTARRERVQSGLEDLPAGVRRRRDPDRYPVEYSATLTARLESENS
jgi:nicotinate phosphoribosyltransferase